MRLYALACLPLAGVLLSAQTLPDTESPLPEPRVFNLSDPQSPHCADVIREVRDATGTQVLQRGPVTGAEGHMIAAVDKRVDGCSVMQMHGNVNDLRPLPEIGDEDFRLQPAAE